MSFIKKYICELVLAVNIFIIPFNHNFDTWFERPVINDAFGYYAYLPAVFLYQDLEYDFMYKIWDKHYSAIGKYDPKGGFIVKQKNEEVNKYPPGVAYFQAPFFLISHGLALLLGLEADGYSTIYMVIICIGAMFWQYVFFLFLRKIFNFYNLSDVSFAWTVVFMSLGTNLYFYTQMFGAYSHLYSLLSITIFFYGGLRFFHSENFGKNVKFFLLMVVGYALAIVTRNMNVFCILLLPCMGFRFSEFSKYLKFLASPLALLSLLLSFAVIFSMLFLWYLQTGHWLIDSYPGEGFNWAHPKILKSLFSPHKGWFFYTPIALIALFGLFYAPKKIRWNFLILLTIIVYIVSSWYAWDYGTGFSLRAYIDWYLPVAIGMGFLFHNLKKRILIPVISLCIILSSLNVWWTVQFMRGIINGSSQGIEHFAKYFFQYKHVMSFRMSRNSIVKEKLRTRAFKAPDYALLNAEKPFSEYLSAPLPNFLKSSENGRVQFGGEINIADRKNEIFLVGLIVDSKDSTLYWHSFNTIIYMEPGEWLKAEGGFIYPDGLPKGCRVKVFFWEPKGNTICMIRNLFIRFCNVRPD